MSDNAPTDRPPIQELGALVHHLADELAAFRRRALVSEARLKEIEGHEGGAGAVNIDLASRVAHLEKDNERLQAKLETATSKAKQMLDRVRFLRQQAQGGER
jgi:chromosome segregation ATPase